jgi:hypothetical protein
VSDGLDELRAAVTAAGEHVTVRRLRDWERQGALGHNRDTDAQVARAVGISRYLAKRQPFGARPDLPTRRRVAEAPAWLWYDGWDIPHEEIRERVLALLSDWDAKLAELRLEVSAGIEEWEQPIAAAEHIARDLQIIPELSRQVRAFASELHFDQDELPPNRHEQLRDAYAQLFQVLQGSEDVELDRFGRLMQAPLISNRATSEPTLEHDELEGIARRLSLDALAATVTALPEDDWPRMRFALAGILEHARTLATTGDSPELRQLGRHTRVPVTTDSLLFQIAVMCSLWPILIAAVRTKGVQ